MSATPNQQNPETSRIDYAPLLDPFDQPSVNIYLKHSDHADHGDYTPSKHDDHSDYGDGGGEHQDYPLC